MTRARPFALALAALSLAACEGVSTRPAELRGARSASPVAAPEPLPPMPMTSSEPVAAPAETVAPAPAPPKPPPYDLAADVARRTEEAKARFGPKTPVSVEHGVFVVVGTQGSGSLDGTLHFTRRVLDALLNGRFDKKPERALSVLLFPTAAPYEKYCKDTSGEPCISGFGFYQPSSREIVMNVGPGIGTLSHELVHPIVETDFPDAPTWINEGIASLYEQPLLPKPGEIHGGKNWRHPRLMQGIGSPKEKDEARLDALFGMSHDRFRNGKESLHYAMARYVCQWLDAQDKLWPFYRRWRDNAKDDPTGAKSFAAVVGKTPTEANDAWLKWVRQL